MICARRWSTSSIRWNFISPSQAAVAPGESVSAAAKAALFSDGRVVIQPGNNLWRIAHHTYGEGTRYTVIFDANKDQIRDPDLIYPGQIFTVPAQE